MRPESCFALDADGKDPSEAPVSNHIEALNSSMQKTNEWIRDVAQELGDDNRHHAYAALRATLHALRDRLSLEQNAHE